MLFYALTISSPSQYRTEVVATMADPFEELDPFEGLPLPGVRGMKVFVSMDGGVRMYKRLPNGEIGRTIEETHLIPGSDYKFSTIFILPNPTAAYEDRPFDAEVAPQYFGTAMLEIDRRHGIQSVAAVAAHRNGTVPLTPQILPRRLIKMDEDDFTLWCTLTYSDGTSKIIKVSP